jgi:hypothetical protein
MTPDQRLKVLLSEHGVAGQPVDARTAWDAFKCFGREVANQESVGLLFQIGTFSFSGDPLFYFDPVVQFEVRNDEGEHDHYEQTHCELTGPASIALQDTKCTIWSFDFETIEAFYEAVEKLPEFRRAIEHSPYKVNAYHEDV